MGEETITTGVDELIAYLRGKDRVSLQDATIVLNIPLDTLQAWVDFLVEEKILGIEYKFTKPYVYLNRDAVVEDTTPVQETPTLEAIRKAFLAHARDKRIPDEKMITLWRVHVQDGLERKRTYFIEQAMRRSAPDPERLWSEYRKDLIARCERA